MIRVTVISQKGKSALVQYVEGGAVHRKYIPASAIKNGAADDEVLAQGIPHGYPWADVNIVFDAQKFEREMHNVDLWSVEDALKNPNRVWSALRATLSENIKDILTVARVARKEKGKNNGK